MTTNSTTSTLGNATNTPRPVQPLDFSATNAEEPLGQSLAPIECPATWNGALAHRFEVSSRGDRVPGRLLLPESRSGPCPLAIALGAAGSSYDSASFDFLAPLVASGFAIATIDLSLYGERKSAKFTERLLSAIGGAQSANNLDANGQALLVEFTRQSVSDVTRTLDALAALAAIDAGRIAILGIGHGAALAAIAANADPRAKAVVLAGCSEIDFPQIDPRGFVAAISPREVLVLDTDETSDDVSIFGACGEPRTRHIVGSTGTLLDSDGGKVAREFLARHLAKA